MEMQTQTKQENTGQQAAAVGYPPTGITDQKTPDVARLQPGYTKHIEDP